MPAGEKPSSLRLRVGRVRRAFGRRADRLKVVVGALVVALAAMGLLLAF